MSLRRSVTVNVAPPSGLLWAVDGAAMRVDDRPRDREADPEAVRFRRDEWCEQRADDIRRQTRSRVAHGDLDVGGPDRRFVIVM